MIIRSPEQLAILVVDQRKKLGLTQSEVAERVGLKQKTISAFENNPESVMLPTAFLILSALHLDITVAPKVVDNESSAWGHEW